MIEWIFLALVLILVAAAVMERPRSDDHTLPKEYCDLECKECDGCK